MQRTYVLLGLSPLECDLIRRVWVAAVLGAAIGLERRVADRPAGVTTVSVVSVGAAVFTIVSAFGFNRSPVFWDSSRVSAMIPKGIGFLCAGVIFKQGKQGIVRGVTTAASLWLSGAVGTASGCALYYTACFTALLTVAILKFGPRKSERAVTSTNGSGYPNEATRLLEMMPRRRRGPTAFGGGQHPLGEAAVMLDW